jgi:hypothetical protein
MAGENHEKPAKSGKAVIAKRSSSAEIGAFLRTVATADPSRAGRLIFALDATMSRQPTWDRAVIIQASMFDAVDQTGGLAVQLVYFRGHDECRASKWVINAAALRNLMIGIDCRGGQTQIGKVLTHTLRETETRKVQALVYIGDAMEENIDQLCRQAGELGLLGVRGFFFQEGQDPQAEQAFREMARLTGGAWFRLGPDSARELAELLAAVALYARGGLKALSDSSRSQAHRLLEQISPSRP